jgi:hypothetical protein
MKNKLISIQEAKFTLPKIEFSDLEIGSKFMFLKPSRNILRHWRRVPYAAIYHLVNAVKTDVNTYINMDEKVKRRRVAKKYWVVLRDPFIGKSEPKLD